MKPSFQTEWLALSPKETHQVLEKIAMLTDNPYPDGKVKKQLKYLNGKLHRIRSGDYRIFYTFQHPYISLLSLVRRREDTYDEAHDAEYLGGLDFEMPGVAKTAQPDWEQLFAPRPPEKKLLPEPITDILLTRLHVPEEYHARLVLIQTQQDLLDCLGVPDDILLKIDEVMFERPLAQVLQQPDYVLHEVDDLERFKNGELLEFLLKLSPEQEKVSHWSMNVTGPTQVKGNPGTGKSTVALYRIRSLIENLRKTNAQTPRVLYTTYTNALVKSSQQLLERLLNHDVACVEVVTADRLVRSLVEEQWSREERRPRIAEDKTLLGAIKRARQECILKGNSLQTESLGALSDDYLLEEICQVIIARNVVTREAYEVADRSGRKFRLTPTQKAAIWHLYECFLTQLTVIHQRTWQQVRLEAEAVFNAKYSTQKYDAVIVDEAQDLDPSVVRLLVGMCTAINRFFITADANQSIYRREFSWADVHESLRFQGRRTTILSTNYRSTRQISEAAQSYLAGGALETEQIESVHLYEGPLPLVRKVKDELEEFDVLANFLPAMAHESRVLINSCAVLCPTKEKGMTIAQQLMKRNVRATFMSREQVNLKYSGVKVLTLHSSKGLEFPIVALAGFGDSYYNRSLEDIAEEERDAVLARQKRILFVGMTRAMRTLLLLVPAQTSSPLLSTFDTRYWKILE